VFNFNNYFVRSTAIAISVTAGSIAMLSSMSAPTVAQNTTARFPDTEDYWAQPFIAALAERNIVTGYPDGTYRPEESVDRDEFASILQAAFNQPIERRIASGSVYKDVPQGYWAAPQIESAYQMGFMTGYPGGYFRPRQPVTKVEALVSLAQNLNLSQGVPSSKQAATNPASKTQASTQVPANHQSAVQNASQRRANRRYILPIAGVMLLQPFITPRSASATPANQTAAAPSPNPNPASKTTTKAANPPTAQRPASVLVAQYYEDANRIPQYAVDEVAQATREPELSLTIRTFAN
jgi:S-layer homology domain